MDCGEGAEGFHLLTNFSNLFFVGVGVHDVKPVNSAQGFGVASLFAPCGKISSDTWNIFMFFAFANRGALLFAAEARCGRVSLSLTARLASISSTSALNAVDFVFREARPL